MSGKRKQRRKNVTSSEELIRELIKEVQEESLKTFNSIEDLLKSERKLRKSITTARRSFVSENGESEYESEYDSGGSGYDTAPEYDDEKKDAPKRYVVTERGAVVNGLDVAISCLQGVQEYKASLNNVLHTLNGVLHTIAASPPVKFIHDTSVKLVSMLKL
jgi:hypothetical protein